MISIQKGKEPRSLKEYRNSLAIRNYVGDVWKDGPKLSSGLTLSIVKQDIRESLYREQHGLCAYCLRALSRQNNKIEHFLPRSKHPEHALCYSNMLLCCVGCCRANELTCDTCKGDALLKQVFNPAEANRDIENFVLYAPPDDSTLLWKGSSGADDANDDINLRLNLNCETLKSNRNERWRDFLLLLAGKYKKLNNVNKDKELTKLRLDENPKWTPYVGYLAFRLEQLRHGS